MKILKNIYSNLTKTSETEPLSRFILVMILMLDVFVFYFVAIGISQNIKQIKSPSEYVPYWCQDIVRNHGIKDGVENKVQVLVLNHVRDSNYYSVSNSSNREHLHPICKSYYDALSNIKNNDKTVIGLFTKRESLNNEYNVIKKNLGRLSVPNVSPNIANNAINTDIQSKYERLNNVYAQIQEIDVQIFSNQSASNLKQLIVNTTIQDREVLESDLRRFDFLYPIQKLLMKAAFLIPLFAVLYWWFCRNIRNNKPMQKVVSAHMLVVVSIPLLFEMMNVLSNILPKTLLAKILAFLSSVKLIALYSYVVIGLSILLFVWFINLIQKKFFAREKVVAKRLAKNSCIYCATKFPPNNHITHCFNCGKNQFVSCKQCGKETYNDASFCSNCGDENYK